MLTRPREAGLVAAASNWSRLDSRSSTTGRTRLQKNLRAEAAVGLSLIMSSNLFDSASEAGVVSEGGEAIVVVYVFVEVILVV